MSVRQSRSAHLALWAALAAVTTTLFLVPSSPSSGAPDEPVHREGTDRAFWARQQRRR